MCEWKRQAELGQAELEAKNKRLFQKNRKLADASNRQIEKAAELEVQNRELKAQLASAVKEKRRSEKELFRQAKQAAETCERWAREEVTGREFHAQMLSVI